MRIKLLFTNSIIFSLASVFILLASQSFAADNLKFTFGNSGVVRLSLNNSLLNFEGRKRSVRHFKVDSSGIERLFSPPILKIE